MKRYKLVTQKYTTQENTLWSKGIRITAIGHGNELCSNGVIHSYESPELAVLLNPIHANIPNPRLLIIECGALVADDCLKGGHKWAIMKEEIPLPIVTPEIRVTFSILCALEVYSNKDFEKWADKWLSGVDRSVKAAWSAARSAAWSEESAARSAVWSAASAAWSRRRESTRSAASAARSAASAGFAVSTKNKINFVKLAKQAFQKQIPLK